MKSSEAISVMTFEKLVYIFFSLVPKVQFKKNLDCIVIFAREHF